MASWSCERNLLEDSYSTQEEESKLQPNYMLDPDYNGIEHMTSLRCEHGKQPARRVASSGENTRRRLLGCPYEFAPCSLVHWVDPVWELRAGTIIGKLSNDNKDLTKNVDRLDKEWRDLLRMLAAFEEERRLNLILDKERYDEALEATKSSSSAKRKVIWLLSTSLVVLLAAAVFVQVTGM